MDKNKKKQRTDFEEELIELDMEDDSFWDEPGLEQIKKREANRKKNASDTDAADSRPKTADAAADTAGSSESGHEEKTGTEAEASTKSEAETDSEAAARSEAETGAEAGAETDSEAVAKAGAEVSAEAGAETDSATAAKEEPEAAAKSEAETGAEAGAETDSATAAKKEPEAAAKSEAETGAETEAEVSSEAAAKEEPEAGAKAEAEADSEAESKEVPEALEEDYSEEDFDPEDPLDKNMENGNKRSGKFPVGLFILYAVVIAAVGFTIWVCGTNNGKKFGFNLIAKYIHSSVSTSENDMTGEDDTPVIIIADEDGESLDDEVDESYTAEQIEEYENFVPRSEDYVTTYLIFGIEEIDGAANTDAMMLVSINTKDNTIKLTSLLRDTYVAIPGYLNGKLNSVYAKGAKGATTGKEAKDKGSALLIQVIEHTYDIDISGYACVNFSRFEKIIDLLGGIDIELGEEEAEYLNTTNYISDPANRTVTSGKNHLNGNQALGYVRVRKVATLGGANNDYGRTLRQRRVINAIINKYKSYGLMDMVSIMNKCLNYVYTDITEEQLTDLLANIVNNSIYTTKSFRLPADELFVDAGKTGIFNGNKYVTYAIVIDDYLEENIKKLHQFIFLDE